MEVGLYRVGEDGFMDPVQINEDTIGRAALMLQAQLPPGTLSDDEAMRVAEIVLRAALRC